MEVNLPKKLEKALQKEADDAKIGLHAHLVKKLENITPAIEYIDINILHKGLPVLVDYLSKIPGINVMSSEVTQDAYWWIKFDIDINHKLAWHVVQELGYVFNYYSISEPLPTIFKPVSPPPYLNGGPEFLSWVIEPTFNYIDPSWILDMISGRLPSPIEDENQWLSE